MKDRVKIHRCVSYWIRTLNVENEVINTWGLENKAGLPCRFSNWPNSTYTSHVTFSCRRRPAGRTQYASPQPVVYSSAPPARTTQNRRFDGILSSTYMMTNQDTHYTSLQTQQNSEQRSLSELQPTSHNPDSSYAQEPPAYITVSKLEPPDPPPSYEEVTSNPTEFNA